MENMENNLSKDKVVGNITKNVLDKSLARSIVIKTTEWLLPLSFWIGIVAITIFSFAIAVNKGKILLSIGIFVPSIVVWIVSFYLIYLLKDIKDALVNK